MSGTESRKYRLAISDNGDRTHDWTLYSQDIEILHVSKRQTMTERLLQILFDTDSTENTAPFEVDVDLSKARLSRLESIALFDDLIRLGDGNDISFNFDSTRETYMSLVIDLNKLMERLDSDLTRRGRDTGLLIDQAHVLDVDYMVDRLNLAKQALGRDVLLKEAEAKKRLEEEGLAKESIEQLAKEEVETKYKELTALLERWTPERLLQYTKLNVYIGLLSNYPNNQERTGGGTQFSLEVGVDTTSSLTRRSPLTRIIGLS